MSGRRRTGHGGHAADLRGSAESALVDSLGSGGHPDRIGFGPDPLSQRRQCLGDARQSRRADGLLGYRRPG